MKNEKENTPIERAIRLAEHNRKMEQSNHIRSTFDSFLGSENRKELRSAIDHQMVDSIKELSSLVDGEFVVNLFFKEYNINMEHYYTDPIYHASVKQSIMDFSKGYMCCRRLNE